MDRLVLQSVVGVNPITTVDESLNFLTIFRFLSIVGTVRRERIGRGGNEGRQKEFLH